MTPVGNNFNNFPENQLTKFRTFYDYKTFQRAKSTTNNRMHDRLKAVFRVYPQRSCKLGAPKTEGERRSPAFPHNLTTGLPPYLVIAIAFFPLHDRLHRALVCAGSYGSGNDEYLIDQRETRRERHLPGNDRSLDWQLLLPQSTAVIGHRGHRLACRNGIIHASFSVADGSVKERTDATTDRGTSCPIDSGDVKVRRRGAIPVQIR